MGRGTFLTCRCFCSRDWAMHVSDPDFDFGHSEGREEAIHLLFREGEPSISTNSSFFFTKVDRKPFP